MSLMTKNIGFNTSPAFTGRHERGICLALLLLATVLATQLFPVPGYTHSAEFSVFTEVGFDSGDASKSDPATSLTQHNFHKLFHDPHLLPYQGTFSTLFSDQFLLRPELQPLFPQAPPR